MELEISDGAEQILKKLNNAGHMAYIAGGAVRDLLMDKTPHDYDIATSALPEEVKALFERTIDTGIKHGTVTVVDNKEGYEVTTFRRDGSYEDNRRPSYVEFVERPEEDSRRRDFTINAMMYNPAIGLLDYFGGREDIEKRSIRCVGEPEQRFREDALRMLRAVRFRAQLDFKIHPDTERAIRKCAVLIRKVSGERVRDELNKILLSGHPEYLEDLRRLGLMKYILPELEVCFGEPQKNKYHIYDVGEHIMHTISSTPRDIVLRWSALLHDIGKPLCSSTDQNGIIHFYGHHRESRRIAVDILHRIHMDNDSIHDISVLVENHDYRVDPNYTAVKRMMARTGAELFEKLLMLQKADNKAKNPIYYQEKKRRIDTALEIYRDVIASHQPYRISDLVVNGRDLMRIGCRQGREIGDLLKHLLDEVIIKPEMNNRKDLINRAKELRHR